MRYYETRSIEVLQHIFDDIFRMKIQVVRGFIHDNHMGFCEEHLGECYLGSFSSGERLDTLFNFVSCNEKSAEHRANLAFFFMVFSQFCDNTLLSIQISEYLGIGSDDKIWVDFKTSRKYG